MAGQKILIVGSGRPLYFLARSLLTRGDAVTLVNADRDECEWLARKLKAVVVHGDGSVPRVLEDAGVGEMDTVLAATARDEKNLIICHSAMRLFDVPRTLALVNDPELEPVFHKLEIPEAFSITKILSSLMERRVETAGILNLVPLDKGNVTLTEIVLAPEAPSLGKSLAELALPQDCLVVCIFRNDATIVPRGSTVLETEDRLVVMSTPKSHEQALNMLAGETP